VANYARVFYKKQCFFYVSAIFKNEPSVLRLKSVIFLEGILVRTSFFRVLICLFLFFSCLISLAAPRQSLLSGPINQLLSKKAENESVGVAIMDARTGKILYTHNGHQAFTPASNIKLLTAATALYVLGPHYRYKTSLAYSRKKVRKHVLHGNVYIMFSGDPTLSIQRFQTLIGVLARNKLRKITGNIILDPFRFSGVNHAPGVPLNDRRWHYSAPISAILINQNKLFFQLRPSPSLHRRVRVFASQAARRYARVQPSHVMTTTYADAMKRCTLHLHVSDQNQIYLTGCWPASRYRKGLKIAIANPVLFAKKIIARTLNKNKIKLLGSIKVGKTPKKIKTIAVYRSPPLNKLLITMMKKSNNIYADSLVKTLGFVATGVGSFQRGDNVVKRVLHEKTGIDFSRVDLADGSGASRYDLLSPLQFARLLFVMHHSKYAHYFERSLPVSGVDGTLTWRMASTQMKGRVMAKTGTLRGVSSLSGYITTQKKHLLIFSIMVNHIIGLHKKAMVMEDSLLSIVHRTR
jgi:serine-type D-Ala-D-Ala carboxypeptidase/endopeptidase (penicillin-binding protein 4)